ncbi:MAG: glycosyltransferase family 39 protein, partial [Patescibacteria group bacterium]
RLWKLDQVPVSLFGDELDVGYHAYSILKTGKDYSGNFMPRHFQSLAEWRTPLYLYSAVPTVAMFGISPWGVRLPAALFGILGVWLFYLLVRQISGKESLALLSALGLAISPWHVQYSRAGFEVTQMLALYVGGIYLFLKGLREWKYLWVSAVCLALTPWVYSTAKLFLPITIIILFTVWRKEIFKVSKKYLMQAVLAFVLVVSPMVYTTMFGGGATRFNYISVFSDPTMVPEIGEARLRDAKMRDPNIGIGVQPTLSDRIFHNKFTWLGSFVFRNYLQTFSTDFLFIRGDPNPRHSPQGIGQLYKIEFFILVAGLAFLLFSKLDKKIKAFVVLWLLLAPLPAALTRDGGNHATRLFFLLPPLVFLVSYGVWGFHQWVAARYKKLFAICYTLVLLASFVFYQHLYWIHHPWDSERWWHAGFEDAIKTAASEYQNYDKIIISMSSEPAYIFLLGWSQFDPSTFHKNYIQRGESKWLDSETIPGFGKISKLEKYYFGSAGVDLYSLAGVLPDNTLYLATAKDVNVNLILEPQRLPSDLKLIKSSPFPSGEPAYYLLTKNTQ